MAPWRKRQANDVSVDFDTLELILGDVIESFDTTNIDFTKPFKVGFTLALDKDGCIMVKEFGLVTASHIADAKKEQPLTEMIDFGGELLAVVELNGLSKQDVAAKIEGDKIIVSGRPPKRFSSSIKLPCPVDPNSIKMDFNNSVLEIRIQKQNIEPPAKA